ncbi:MAG: hypothetical protein KatS3mg102_1948 [Planctomycetota bacterium]|nr:MAG: hypothetical protein KatS3mg102_1948 [Planctomycetota bacterium]
MRTSSTNLAAPDAPARHRALARPAAPATGRPTAGQLGRGIGVVLCAALAATASSAPPPALLARAEADLAALGPPLPAWIGGRARARLTRHEEGLLRLQIDAPALRLGGFPLGRASLVAIQGPEGRRAQLELVRPHGGGRLRLRWSAPADGREHAWILHARELALAPFARYLPGVRLLGGRLELELLGAGPPGAEHWVGRARLRQGRLALAGPYPSWERLEAAVGLEGDRLLVEQVRAEAGGGTLSVRGSVRLAGPERGHTELALAAHEALLLSSRTLRVRASGELALVGSPARARLHGRLHLIDARYFGEPEPPALGGLASPTELLPEQPGPLAWPGELALQIELTSEPALWIDNSAALLRCSLTGQLGGHAAAPRLRGILRLHEGTVDLYDASFRVERGALLLEDSSPPALPAPDREPAPACRIDLDARTRRGHTVVLATARGPTIRPEIELRALPPLEREDIVSLLAFGTTREQARERAPSALLGSVLLRSLALALGEALRGRNRDLDWLAGLSLEAGLHEPQSAAEVGGPVFLIVYEAGEHWELEAERDIYGFYNLGVFWRWRLR